MRDAAIARFAVIGVRAVSRLVSVAENGSERPAVRAAAYRALEIIGDERGLESALKSLRDPDTVAAAAIGAAAAFLPRAQGVRVVDLLVALTLDRSHPDELRVAALGALGELKPSTVRPLLRTLANDPSQTVAATASSLASRP